MPRCQHGVTLRHQQDEELQAHMQLAMQATRAWLKSQLQHDAVFGSCGPILAHCGLRGR